MSREREYIEPDFKKVKIEGDEDIAFKDENNGLIRYTIKKEVKVEVKDEPQNQANMSISEQGSNRLEGYVHGNVKKEGGPTVHEDDRKLFVGALPQDAKDTDIKEYFESYGEIEDVNLKMDAMTGRSRGFAFVIFKTVEGINASFQQDAHVVKGKKVTCKKAEARQGKIYVGKLPAGEAMSKEDLEAHFGQFGEVVEVVRPVDKMKNNEPKSFAFITFARQDAAKTLVKQGSTVIGEHSIEIKKVTSKDQSGGMGSGWGAGDGGYGGGWGYADLYAGYGGYGGYGDPYSGYGFGGVWGGAGYGGGPPGGGAGGKMRGGGARGSMRGRGRGGGEGGRPY